MQRNPVVGTRSSLLWLLILVVGVVLIGALVGAFVILPQMQASRTEQARLAEVERHYRAGVAFQSVADWTTAEGEYRQVISLDAGYEDAQARLAEVKGKLAEMDATATAVVAVQTVRVQADATAAAQAAPIATTRALDTRYQRALGFINLKQWVEAQAELRAIFDLDPNYGDVQAQLALVHAEVAKLTPAATSTSVVVTSAVTSTPVVVAPTSRSTPQPALSVSLPFEDAFDGGIRPEWDYDKGKWSVINGALTSVGIFRPKVALVGNTTWKNYALDADFVLTGYEKNNYVGFVVSAESKGEYIALFFDPEDSGNTYWVVYEDGKPVSTLDSKSLYKLVSNIHKSHHVRIEVRGENRVAYLDGAPLSQVFVPSLPGGGLVGVQMAEEQVSFVDNFKVSSLE